MKRPLITPARPTLLMLAALVPSLTAGCGGDDDPSGVTVDRELTGDTVVMVSSGEPERVRIETVEVLWQSDELEGRTMRARMAPLGDHLVIGDERQVHVVSIKDGGAHTFGRQGQGPGEIQQIVWSVGGFGTDTIGVFDGIQVLLFSLDGEFLTSYRTTPPIPFTGPVSTTHGGDRPVYPLVRSGSGVLWARTSMDVRADGTGTERKAILWHDLEADTAAVLDMWDYWGGGRGYFRELVMHAIASDGRVAAGDPATYCIRLSHAFEEGSRAGCRERSRAHADVLPHFSRLLFSESGDLWVNLYHEEFAHVPRGAYDRSGGAWQPTIYEWEVFDRDAVLVRHVTLPGAFDLRVIGDGEAFGFLTLDTGEVVVGRVDLTGSVVPPT